MKILPPTQRDYGNSDREIPEKPPAWIKRKCISELTTIQPDQILRGILYRGCKLILMAGSKSFKTWALMDIAYCVANGLLWWGVHTKQCPVIYLDFELLDYDFRWRLEQIQKAYGMGDIDAVARIGLRGKELGPTHWSCIHEEIIAANAGLMLCDPTYKMLGPYRDENSAGDIAQVTAIFDRVTEATGAAAAYAQHYTKGNQAHKESIDRGAGSGVWARDADAILTMTKHAEGDDYLSVEHTLRSFPRIDPFVVRWEMPLFKRMPELDAADLKQPPSKKGRTPKYGTEQLVSVIGDQSLAYAEFLQRTRMATGMVESTFNKQLKKAAKENKIHHCRIDETYEKVMPPPPDTQIALSE
jgi:AAA domain